MNSSVKTATQCLRTGLLFGGCLALAFLLPWLGIFLGWGSLFFVPQYLFPYHGFVIHQPQGSTAVFSHTVAFLLSFIQWGLAAAGFAWFARRLPTPYAIIAAVATVVLIGVVVNLAFGLFGVAVELDGL